jgi:hypothetical protein
MDTVYHTEKGGCTKVLDRRAFYAYTERLRKAPDESGASLVSY